MGVSVIWAACWAVGESSGAGLVAALEQVLRALADARTVKAGVLIQAARIAMTGGMVSPGIFEMLVLIGRDDVVRRLDTLANTL